MERIVKITSQQKENTERWKGKVNDITRTGNYVLLIKFQEDNLNCEDGVSPLKNFQIRMEQSSEFKSS